MGGRTRMPLVDSPVLNSATASASLQRGKPAMPGARAAQIGTGTVGSNAKAAPCNFLPVIGSPCSSCGVWQSPHRATLSIRYFPRSILGSDAGGLSAAQLNASKPIKPAAAMQIFIIESTLLSEMKSLSLFTILRHASLSGYATHM